MMRQGNQISYYLISVPNYRVLYSERAATDIFLGRHTQPQSNFQKDVQLADSLTSWYSLVEIVS